MPEESRPDSIVFHEYPKLIYIWPLIVMGYAFFLFSGPRMIEDPQADPIVQQAAAADSSDSAQQGVTTAKRPMISVGGENEFLGWVYLLLLFLVLLTVGVDVERNYAVFWVVAIVAIWLACWLLNEKDIPVFSHIYRFFAGLNASYDRGFGLAFSIFLTFPYVTMIVWARLNSRWRITHNEFEHYAWGRADDSLARGAKRVRSTYPDILEFLLCGAGTLIVYSATGRGELRRIHNVPLLFLKRRKINAILESTHVTMNSPYDTEALADEEAAAANEEEGGPAIGSEKL